MLNHIEKYLSFKTKSITRAVLFYVSANIFHVWLNEDSGILISAFEICCDMLFNWKSMEKIWLLIDIELERGKYLDTLVHNCWYSLMLHQNSTSDSFQEVSCNVESEIKSTDLSCTLRVFYPCMTLLYWFTEL